MMRISPNSLWFLAFLIIIPTASFAAGTNGFTLITADQLKNEIMNPNVVVLDVRVEPEWNSSESKIKGAVRESPKEVDDWMSKYAKDKTIVLYCD